MRPRSLLSGLTVALLLSACGHDAPTEPAPLAKAIEAKPVDMPSAPAVPPAPSDVGAAPADAEQLAGGVATKRLAAGRDGEPPAANDCVRVHYTSWKRSGQLFSSSRARSRAPLKCLGKMIAGLRTAILTMREGEQRRVWIPGALTFVPTEPDDAAPNEDLTFDVELVEILRAPVTPRELDKPAATAKKLPSGLAYLVLEPGRGTEKLGPTQRARVRFSGWKRDGSLFETTELDDHPALISPREVMPGLREAVSLMVVGEKARFWIPAKLAYGDKPTRPGFPAGALVYDIELLAIE
jgi:FKBP-type peptidyl-prolyl cis-trans isomerase